MHALTSSAFVCRQAALGELTFESEAAERLRGELRAAGRQLAEARGAAGAAAAAAEAAAAARSGAEEALGAARAEAREAADRQAAAAVGCLLGSSPQACAETGLGQGPFVEATALAVSHHMHG